MSDLPKTPQKNSKKLVLKIAALSLMSFIALAVVGYLSFYNYKIYETLLNKQEKLSQAVLTAGQMSNRLQKVSTRISLGKQEEVSKANLALSEIQKNIQALTNIDDPLLRKAFDTLLEVKKQSKTLNTFFTNQTALLSTGSKNIEKIRWLSQQIKEETERLTTDLATLSRQLNDFEENLQSNLQLQKKEIQSYKTDSLIHLYFILMALGVVIFFGHLVGAYLIAKPLTHLTQRMRDINNGKINDNIQGTERNDEFGDIARMLHTFRENALKIEQMQQHLQETITQSKKASQIKNQFIARMGHELRTPLNAIIGYSEMIVDSVEDKMDLKKLRQDIKHIANAGQNLLSMVDSVLELTEDEDNAVLKTETFNVREEVQQILPNLEVTILKNRNKFKVHCPDASLVMDSDPKKTMRIISNLIENAANFTKEGQITLDITAGSLGDLKAICFKVKDTGCGIAPSKIGTLFGAFEQANTMSTDSQGTIGLGLAIVKKTCDDLHGQVSVESTLNQGSTFYVTLPANHEEAHQRIERLNLSPLAEAI